MLRVCVCVLSSSFFQFLRVYCIWLRSSSEEDAKMMLPYKRIENTWISFLPIIFIIIIVIILCSVKEETLQCNVAIMGISQLVMWLVTHSLTHSPALVLFIRFCVCLHTQHTHICVLPAMFLFSSLNSWDRKMMMTILTWNWIEICIHWCVCVCACVSIDKWKLNEIATVLNCTVQ